MTRASLLASLREGRAAEGWQDFFRQYAPAIYRVALLRRLSSDQADDIVQQVMMSVARRIGDFDYKTDRGKFRNWICSITENKIRDHYRTVAQDARLTQAAAEQQAQTANDCWEVQWRLQDLMICLDELSEDVSLRQLETFRLYVIEGLAAEEVARRMEMSVGQVYVIRTTMIKRIRERMRDVGTE